MARSLEIGAALAMTASLLAGCNGEKAPVEPEKSSANSVPIVREISPADQAKADYIAAYGCRNEVRIVVGDTVEGAAIGGNTLATAEPGQITLDSEDWATFSAADQRNTILHEMTHACKPAEQVALQPYVLGDGAKVNAAHGLNLLVTLPDGENTGFRLIEEGAAEALAHNIDSSFATKHDVYFRIGALTLDLMNQSGITPTELSGYVQNNDLMGYVGALYGQDTGTYQQLEDTMISYGNA